MLHDVSKGDRFRIKAPMPNADDRVPPEVRMAHDTTQINYSDETDTLGQGVKLYNGKIEVRDSSNNTHTRIGYDDTDADNKTKVARPGTSL